MSSSEEILWIGQFSTFLFFVIWWISYRISAILSSKLSKSYNTLEVSQKIEWDSRVVSTFHSLLSVLFSILALTTDKSYFESKNGVLFEYRASIYALIATAITLSFWIYDLILVLINWQVFKDYTILLHHISGIIPFGFGMYYGNLVLYGPLVLLTEASTPFVNFRWSMAVSNMSNSTYYKVNGLMMWLTFLLFRILWLPYVTYLFWLNREGIALSYKIVVYPTLFGVITVFCLSSYWFRAISLGLIKVLKNKKNKD